jgi:ADP-ribose pyrophosphatase YjhB (NUDIX family)
MDSNPKNHFKYCPRCAASALFNESDLSLSCVQCGFHFFLNASAAVTALIFNQKEKLLFTLRGVEPSIGALDLPGGFVDPGECAEDALMREISEELDLIPEQIEYYGSFPNKYHYSGTVVNTVDLVFKCKVNDFSQLKYRDDIIGLKFILPQEVDLNEVPFESVKNILKRINQEKRSINMPL